MAWPLVNSRFCYGTLRHCSCMPCTGCCYCSICRLARFLLIDWVAEIAFAHMFYLYSQRVPMTRKRAPLCAAGGTAKLRGDWPNEVSLPLAATTATAVLMTRTRRALFLRRMQWFSGVLVLIGQRCPSTLSCRSHLGDAPSWRCRGVAIGERFAVGRPKLPFPACFLWRALEWL